MASDSSRQKSPDNVPKHRACDECRSRKLACSKEPDGCSRCKKEGIHCHYSPQKPMGRPRKRRLEEAVEPGTEDQEPTTAASRASRSHSSSRVRHSGSFTPPPAPFGQPEMLGQPQPHGQHVSQPPPVAADPGLNFWDQPSGGGSGLGYVDLLPDNFFDDFGTNFLQDQQQLYPSNPSHEPQLFSGNLGPSSIDDGPFHMNLGTALDGMDTSTSSVSRDLGDSLYRFMADQTTNSEAPLATPDLASSSPSNFSRVSDASYQPESPEPLGSRIGGIKAMPTITCGCLSSLYLALDSLSHLPNEVTSAMRVVRNVSKVAQDVVNCPYCFVMSEKDPTAPPPIQSFQNLMCLGALVPSACNSYAYIMEMIDHEVEQAKLEHRTFWFTFKEVGGLWAEVIDNPSCSALRTYDNKHLSPDMWRSTIRAILKLDIYGLGLENRIESPQRQIGLRNVIAQLTEKTSKRHDMVDALAAAGKLPPRSHYLLGCENKPIPPENRNCVRVLETARMALDKLVIE